MGAASQAAAVSPAALAGVAPNHVNNLDCNGYSSTYQALSPTGRMHCTDPLGLEAVQSGGKTVMRGARFEDNGHYIGHDEPSVKFISHAAGSGNTMSYLMKLPVDPIRPPTPSGSVTDYSELSIAPWFGLPLCDPD